MIQPNQIKLNTYLFDYLLHDFEMTNLKFFLYLVFSKSKFTILSNQKLRHIIYQQNVYFKLGFKKIDASGK